MRPFGAPAASEGRPLPPLGPLGSLVLPLPPALRLLLPTMPTPAQAADILSRAESLRAVATPAPKRVCHMCGVEKLAAKCRTALSDKLIKTFSAALVNSSEACALEPYTWSAVRTYASRATTARLTRAQFATRSHRFVYHHNFWNATRRSKSLNARRRQ